MNYHVNNGILAGLFVLGSLASWGGSVLELSSGRASFVRSDVKIATTDFTLETWMYYDGVPETETSSNPEYFLMRQYYYTSRGRMQFGIRGGELAAFMGGEEGWISSGVTVPVKRWVHVAFVHDGGNLMWKFYMDGRRVGTSPAGRASVPPQNICLTLGDDETRGFPGRMADARVWRCVRSAPEIKLWYDKRLTGREDGLIGYWRLDEESGLQATNLVSGVGNSLGGTAGWCQETDWISSTNPSGSWVTVASLDGSGKIATDVQLPSPSFTIEAWVNCSSTNEEVCICSQYSDTATEAGRMQFSVRDGCLKAFLGSAGGWQDSEFMMPTGVWTHVAFVRDTTEQSWLFYVNGRCVKTVTGMTHTAYGADAQAGTVFFIGGRQYVRWEYAAVDFAFPGMISDVRLWTGVRTADEIASNFRRRLDGDETGLAGYWRLDDVSLPRSVKNIVTGNGSITWYRNSWGSGNGGVDEAVVPVFWNPTGTTIIFK